MKAKKTDDWFPFYIQKWIFGSTRLELEPDERAVFIDLLTLSKMDNGFIRANEGVAYPDEQLAGMLVLPVELLQRTIKKCLTGKIDKMERLPDGTLYVKSHNEYELSKRHKRRLESSPTPPSNNNKNRGEGEERESGKEDTASPKTDMKINFNFKTRKWENITEQDMKEWGETYPNVNMKHFLLVLAQWLLSNPTKKKSNYRRFITNNAKTEQDKGGSKSFKKMTDEQIKDWVNKK